MTISLQRLEELFTEAVALPAAARAEFIDRKCGADMELRARIEGLLRASGAIGGFLATAAVPGLAETTPGTKIGRYKLLEKIGEGGVGIVFMAEQEEPVRRRVALKLIKPGMDTREVIARFESERQALALMDHPHIARVLDAGATENGRPYFVMELVRGIKITDYCDQNMLTTRERVLLFLLVCGAIQHAHQKGVIHRDIKPSNTLVTLHDGVAVPKVIDFGIAKATTGRLTDRTLFTAYAQFIGTPAYMSPEQAEMSGLDVDTRSDIYSLGVLLYELLTGRTPFDATDLTSGGLDEVRRKIRETEPPRLATRLNTLGAVALTLTARNRRVGPPKLLTDLGGDLEWIVGRCLEKDRARRYDTANALAMDLHRHLNDEPIVARPPSAAYAVRKLIRRHRVAFSAGAAVAVALLVSTAFSIRMFLYEKAARTSEAAQRAQAEAGEHKARLEAARSTQVAQLMKDMLRGVGDQVARGYDTQLLRQMLNETARQLGAGLDGQPGVEADLRELLGRTYFELGDYRAATAMHEAALALRRKYFGADRLLVAASLDELGWMRSWVGRYAEAEPMLREALADRRAALGPEHRDIASTLTRLGDVLWRRRKNDEAIALLQEALAMRRKLLGSEHSDVAATLYVLGLAVRTKTGPSQWTDAEPIFREALAMQRKLLGDEHPAVAATLSALSHSLMRQFRWAEAEAALREALATQRKLLGATHPDLAETLGYYGGWLESMGRLAEAEEVMRAAWAMRRDLLGEAHDHTLVFPVYVARILRLQGRFAEAETVIMEAEGNLLRAEGGLKDAARDFYATEHLKVLANLGRWTDAEAYGRRWLSDLHDRQGTAAAAGWRVAEVFSAMGKYAEAEALLPDNLAKTNRQVRLQRAIALAGLGRFNEAEPLVRSAASAFGGQPERLDFPTRFDLRSSVALLARICTGADQPELAASWQQQFAPVTDVTPR